MAENTIAEQLVVEQDMLQSIIEGLRRAIGLPPEGTDFSRKRHTIHFVALSLQRHLDHLLTLEECDGYMDAVVTLSPHRARQVEALRQEHQQFRRAAQQVLRGLDQVAPNDPTTFRNVCEEVLALLNRLEEHTRKEVALVQETFGRDGGGEG
jgi:hemerythrin-like domain-containing protein